MLELVMIVIAGLLLYALLKPPAHKTDTLPRTNTEQARVELSPAERMPAPLTGPTIVRHDAIGETKR
ncbi:hypothetical protein [Paenibacillus xylaniclasticus]|uniref:hypothetical protein n=1 Tax=Paenibacillus xylaniclasticus TaxID=588083 RepID=UPI000FD9030D|nr:MULTISPECIES: hypothetical protein [Paenibacillus]GFN29819.1 hypothetical protein PCURB6_00790 [Paenibacillus curdlanolyticus]